VRDPELRPMTRCRLEVLSFGPAEADVTSSKPEGRPMKTNTAGDTERHRSAAVMLVGTVRTVSATMPALNSGKLGCY